MVKVKDDYKCPKCKKKNRYKIYDEITSNQIPKIIDRTLFTFTCSECHEKITIDYPVILKNKDYIIYYTPSSDKSLKDKSPYSIKRVCDTYDDLKEKILILEDELNDIIIEFIKAFLLTQIPERDEVTNIRYNSKDNNNLIFHLFGINKDISCHINFYYDLKDRSKLKKIKDAIVIDNLTFRKYFKMR